MEELDGFWERLEGTYGKRAIAFINFWNSLTPQQRLEDKKGKEIYLFLNNPLKTLLPFPEKKTKADYQKCFVLMDKIEADIKDYFKEKKGESPGEKEKIKEIKRVLKDYPRPAILDNVLTPILPMLDYPVWKFERYGKALIYKKQWGDGYAKIEYRIPEEVKTEDIEKYFKKYRIPIFLITLQNAFAQRTLSPIIPIGEFSRLGENAIKNIADHYDSLSYVRYERQSGKGKGMKYRHAFELKPIIRKFEKKGEGKGSYIKGSLDKETHAALTLFIEADRKLINREGDAEPLTCDDIKRIYELKQDGKKSNISYRKIPSDFISVWEKRAVKAVYVIWEKFDPIFANKTKTFSIQFETILKDYLEISATEFNTSMLKLAREIEITLNILKEITGIDYGIEKETLKFFENPFIRLTEEDIKTFGLSSVVSKMQNLKREFKGIENLPILTKEKFLSFRIFFIRPLKDISGDAWELPPYTPKEASFDL